MPNWRYEWTFRNFFCHVRKLCKRSCCWNILLTISLADYIAVDVYQKSYNDSRFREFICFHILSKCISEYSILVINNFSTHQFLKLAKLCRKADVELAFLSSYLSDYNLIKQSFHVLKKWMWRHQNLAKSQYKCERTSRLHESFKKREIILLKAKLWCFCRIQDVTWEKKTQFRKQVSNLIASKLV